jgi:hypothetical protein
MVCPKQAGKILVQKRQKSLKKSTFTKKCLIKGVFNKKIFPACLGQTMSFLTKPFEI